jgi:hypothetical protein
MVMTERNRPSAQDVPPFTSSVFPWMDALQGQNFWTTFGTVARAAEPAARSAARAQLEMSSLVGTRVKAWAGIPETLSRCRTPMDLMLAQAAFWQEAGRNYAEASQHMMMAWNGMLGGSRSEAGADHVEPRDYITFPESSETEERRHPGASRRAA